MFSLKFMIPESWIPYLVSFATRAVNMVITSNSINSTTPWENFTGRKLNYEVDLRTFFGQYVQAHQPLIDNSMTARTSACIAMISSERFSLDSSTAFGFHISLKKALMEFGDKGRLALVKHLQLMSEQPIPMEGEEVLMKVQPPLSEIMT
jgi:hypothetical protein